MKGRPWTVGLAVALALLVALTGLVSSGWRLGVAGQRPGAPVLGLPHHVGVLVLLARLVGAALEVLLAAAVWRAVRAARVVQTVWSALVVGAVLFSTVTGGSGAKVGVTGVVGTVGSAAVLVLLWLPLSRAWFRGRSTRSARPPR